MISINDLTVSFGAFDLFKELTFMINPKDRIGLIGKNGAGKSTLMKIIAAKDAPSSGTVSFPKDLTAGYLPQQMIVDNHRTILDEATTAFDKLLDLEKKIESIGNNLAERTDYESDEYNKLMHDLPELSERFHIMGGSSFRGEVEVILQGLGFERSDFNRITKELSGGWRMRIELAKILLKKPDLILLDEPTNHLDIESIEWLEDFLKIYPGAALIVSHDKAFLDNVTNRTIELSIGRITDYKVPYSQYLVLRKERREQQMSAFENQQKMIAETEDFIERFRYKATKAIQVQSRIKQLDKIERLEVEEEDTSSIYFKFPPAPRAGTVVMETIGFTKRYDQKLILDNVDLQIERGEKIGFIGRNGEGKSTLVKAIMEQIQYEGILKEGHNVIKGYFAQNQDELMCLEKTVFETIDEVAVGDIRTQIRKILGSFLFSGETIDKKIGVLSGGERSRLALAKLLLQPYSLLILDEPTNHLDMRSKEILKNALLAYDGTMIVVSHDRDFLDGLVNKIYEFRNKKIKLHLGGIYEFLKKKKLENLNEVERRDKANNTTKAVDSDSKSQYLEKKEWDKQLKKVRNKIEESEQNIFKLEAEIEQMDKLMQNADSQNLNSDFFSKYDNAKTLLNKAMEDWETNTIELENMQKN